MRFLRGMLGLLLVGLLGSGLVACGGGGGGGNGDESGGGGGGNQASLQARVSGLAEGTLILADGRGNEVSVSRDGLVAFPTPPAGARYDITVTGQPDNQICTVSDGSGTFTASTVVDVSCQDGIAFADGASQFLVGQVVSVDVRVAAAPTAVSVDGEAQTFDFIDGLLLLQATTPGQHTLRVTAGGRDFTAAMTVVDTPLPLPPRDYLNSAMSQVETAIDELLPGADAATASVLTQFRDVLRERQGELAGLSDADVELLAKTLAANGVLDALSAGTVAGLSARAIDLDECRRAADEYPWHFTKMAAALTVTVVAAVAQRWEIAIPSAVALLVLKRKGDRLLDSIGNTCFSQFGDIQLDGQGEDSSSQSVRPRAVSANTGLVFRFNHGKARYFLPLQKERVHSMIGPDLQGYINRILAMVDRMTESVGRLLGGDVSSSFSFESMRAYAPERTQPVPPQEVSLSGITDARITGRVGAEGERISLMFRFKEGEMPDAPVSFGFSLVRAGESAGSYQAVLNPVDKPKATAFDVTVVAGETYRGRLAGEFADYFLIVQEPARGQLKMVDSFTGEFTYQPYDPVYTGSDQFSFVAVNDYGESEPAVVTITVVRGECYYSRAENPYGNIVYGYTCETPTDGGTRFMVQDLEVTPSGEPLRIYHLVEEFNALGETIALDALEWFSEAASSGWRSWSDSYWLLTEHGQPNPEVPLPVLRHSYYGQHYTVYATTSTGEDASYDVTLVYENGPVEGVGVAFPRVMEQCKSNDRNGVGRRERFYAILEPTIGGRGFEFGVAPGAPSWVEEGILPEDCPTKESVFGAVSASVRRTFEDYANWPIYQLYREDFGR